MVRVVAQHLRFHRRPGDYHDPEREVIESLDSLERKGYVDKVGETRDLRKFPIYQLSRVGWRLLDEVRHWGTAPDLGARIAW